MNHKEIAETIEYSRYINLSVDKYIQIKLLNTPCGGWISSELHLLVNYLFMIPVTMAGVHINNRLYYS